MALSIKRAVDKVERAAVYLDRCKVELEAMLAKGKPMDAKTQRRVEAVRVSDD